MNKALIKTKKSQLERTALKRLQIFGQLGARIHPDYIKRIRIDIRKAQPTSTLSTPINNTNAKSNNLKHNIFKQWER